METTSIQYRLVLPDGNEEVFDLQLDTENVELVGNVPDDKPEWTQLDFHQCPNCPLTGSGDCPVAANLITVIARMEKLISYDAVSCKVTLDERSISTDTTAQQAIRSLIGLIIAVSGCPHTAFFKPMARFHLPFSTEEETIYRSTSMYLLSRYMMKNDGKDASLELDGLNDIYRNVQIVNTALAKRIKAASKTDSTVNALIILDMFAKALPFVIKDALSEIRYLFKPYLS